MASIEGARAALGQVAAWYPRVRAFPDYLVLAVTAAEIEAARQTGRVAVVLQFQGGNPLEYDVNLVEAFHRLGVRILQLTYNARNPWATGLHRADRYRALRPGAGCRGQVNRSAMLLDLSHVGVRTSLEALEASRGPAIFSHSNARAVCDHPRNLTDEQLRQVARKDGVAGVNAFPAFVRKGECRPWRICSTMSTTWSAVMGPQHVGLGLDFADRERVNDYEYFGQAEFDPGSWTYPSGSTASRPSRT